MNKTKIYESIIELMDKAQEEKNNISKNDHMYIERKQYLITRLSAKIDAYQEILFLINRIKDN